MKTENIIYSVLGILMALFGGGIALQGIAFSTMPGDTFRVSAVLMIVSGGYLFYRGIQGAGRNLRSLDTTASPEAASATRITVEARLDELERLKRRDMVTPEEYATKRQDILNDL